MHRWFRALQHGDWLPLAGAFGRRQRMMCCDGSMGDLGRIPGEIAVGVAEGARSGEEDGTDFVASACIWAKFEDEPVVGRCRCVYVQRASLPWNL